MSQATFDPTTPGGPSDDAGENKTTRGQGSRRRPARRSHTPANTAQSTTESVTQPTAEAEPAAAPAAEESRGRRSRGPAKRPAQRPAQRGKAGAQLIITKANDETPTGASSTTEPVAQDGLAPEAQASAEDAHTDPVVVPVVTAEPRKLRFGLPRRYRQPEAQTVASAPAAAPEPVVAEPVAAETQPEAPAAAPIVEQPEVPAAPRYRFARSSRATATAATPQRPERLSSQRAGLYTGASATSEAPATPSQEEERAATNLIDLPSLDALVGGNDLPALAFDEAAPSATVTPEAEEVDEAESSAEAAESGDGAGPRRRRRRRRGPAHNGAHGAETDDGVDEFALPATEEAQDAGDDFIASAEPEEPAYQEPEQPVRPSYTETIPQRGRSSRYGFARGAARRAPTEPSWEAPTQQPAAEASPFGSPEPSFARGFGPTPNGVATPARESYPRIGRVDRSADPTAASVAQLGSVIREAISTQTDRLLTELRHQQPPAVTLTIPNGQTTERVGVFVDVANVVYSARGLRMNVDFGRMLEFLRANRRLARAQAYAPTNPEPGADQAFLNAVKGLGYRITTKNYKTFANGAKKADLDLDLCMDIVRLVEARAVDTIVLVSGDSDFLPLLDYCYDHGVRVEVAAFDDAASMILRQSCDLFVNLSLVEGIRG